MPTDQPKAITERDGEMKEAQRICREVWEALNMTPTTGWQRQGAHDQCRNILFADGGIATAFPSGYFAIYRAGALLAEGRATQ